MREDVQVGMAQQPQGPVLRLGGQQGGPQLGGAPPAQKAPKWDAGVLAKAEKMKKKTQEIMECFKLPETEVCVQDYRCSFRRAGRMYITPNYVCFWGLGNVVDVIPFRSITNIERAPGLIFNTGINITVEGDIVHSVGSLMRRDETFMVLQHLWKNPLSYVQLAAEQELPPETSGGSNGGFGGFGGFGGLGGDGTKNTFGSPFEVGLGGYDQIQNQLAKADTQASKDALRIALEARDIGVSTLEDLEQQAKIIDNIENDIEQINANLDRGDRYIRGIETFGGAMKNALTNAKVAATNVHKHDRTLSLDRTAPTVDEPILYKNPDDSFTAAILRLGEEEIECITEDGIRTIRKFPYDEIVNIVMRARHLHVDIRFKSPNNPRLRFMSSHLQTITNEIVMRTEPGQILVAFEPGTTVFEYGSFKIADKISGKDKLESTGGGFGRRGAGPSLLTQVASKEVREEIASQERDLDLLENIVGDLGAIANTMGKEIDRQSEQLDRISGKAHETNVRINRTNDRVGNLLK